MTGFDPYKAPAADLECFENKSTGIAITENMISYLKQTRPWVIFLAVLGFVGAGFMVFAALMMLVMGSAGAFMGSTNNGLSAFVSLGIAVLYILIAALYILPCVYLIRYGTSIGRIHINSGAYSIEEALMHQKSFWRTMGIMTATVLVLYIVAIVIGSIVAVVAGVTTAM